MYPVKQSTALTVPFFVHDVSGDAVTSLVDGGFTKRISKNGAAFGAMTVTITEMENGWYSIPLSASHSDTLGLLTILFTHGSSKQINLQFRVHARIPDDLAFPTTTGRSLDVTAAGEAGIDLDNTSGTLAAAQIATDAITAAKIATDAVAEIVDGVWDETMTAHATGDSAAVHLKDVLTDTGTTIPATISTAQADLDTITGSAGAIIDDSAANDTTISDAVWDEAVAGHVGAGTFGATDAAILADTAELQGDWANGGRLDLLLDAIPTTAMRGTDSAALASVCTEARLAELDAANLPADLDLVLADTGELQTDWTNGGRLDLLLDAIPTTAMRGTDSAALASVCTEARLAELAAANLPTDIDAILVDTAALNDTKIPDTISLANINAQVVDVLKTDTITLPGQLAPPLTPTFEEALSWLYKVFRNRKTQTATQWSLLADDESTVDAKATVSDDATTAIKQEVVTGP